MLLGAPLAQMRSLRYGESGLTTISLGHAREKKEEKKSRASPSAWTEKIKELLMRARDFLVVWETFKWDCHCFCEF